MSGPKMCKSVQKCVISLPAVSAMCSRETRLKVSLPSTTSIIFLLDSDMLSSRLPVWAVLLDSWDGSYFYQLRDLSRRHARYNLQARLTARHDMTSLTIYCV